MVASGIWVSGRGIWYLSSVHGKREVEVTIDPRREAFAAA